MAQKTLPMAQEMKDVPSSWDESPVNEGPSAPHHAARPSRSHLSLPTNDGLLYLEHDDILFLQAARSYTCVHCRHERHTACMSLHAFEDRLPARRFFRCHRSYVVNLTAVRRLHLHGGCRLELSTGAEVQVSRRHVAGLKAALGWI